MIDQITQTMESTSTDHRGGTAAHPYTALHDVAASMVIPTGDLLDEVTSWCEAMELSQDETTGALAVAARWYPEDGYTVLHRDSHGPALWVEVA